MSANGNGRGAAEATHTPAGASHRASGDSHQQEFDFVRPLGATPLAMDECRCGQSKRADRDYCLECADIYGMIPRPPMPMRRTLGAYVTESTYAAQQQRDMLRRWG